MLDICRISGSSFRFGVVIGIIGMNYYFETKKNKHSLVTKYPPSKAPEASSDASDWPISIQHVNAKCYWPLMLPQVLPLVMPPTILS